LTRKLSVSFVRFSCAALVDVQMPDMDGYEFVEIIKSHPDTVFIPTILSRNK
jgi:CheY-like chemotaxis protein